MSSTKQWWVAVTFDKNPAGTLKKRGGKRDDNQQMWRRLLNYADDSPRSTRENQQQLHYASLLLEALDILSFWGNG